MTDEKNEEKSPREQLAEIRAELDKFGPHHKEVSILRRIVLRLLDVFEGAY